MRLELDIGNTRIKWRLRSNAEDSVLSRGAVIYGGDFSLGLSGLPFEGVSQIFVAAVLGEGQKQQLVDKLSEYSAAKLWFAEVSSQALGVVCGYESPSQLGVDRWLAILAAYHRYQSGVCVIDAGSALTVDWVDEGGVHRGGYIVPGFSMAKNSLLNKTEKVRFSNDASTQNASGWPSNTKEAVERGLLLQCKGLLEILESNILSDSQQGVKIIVAGGDALLVSSLLTTDVDVYEDVVLDGLSLLSTSENNKRNG